MSGESLDRVHSRSLEVYLTEYRQRGGMSGILWNHCGPVGFFSCESYGDRGVMASVSFAGLLSNVESTETSPDKIYGGVPSRTIHSRQPARRGLWMLRLIVPYGIIYPTWYGTIHVPSPARKNK